MRRGDLIAHVLNHAETDLCRHRAEAPAGLAARQAAAWDSLLDWARATLGVSLPVVAGVIAAPAAPEALAALARHIEALDDSRLAALARATSLAGSAIIGLALMHGRLDAAQAFAAATIDEHWSLEHWGEDEEARARLDQQRTEFDCIARFVASPS